MAVAVVGSLLTLGILMYVVGLYNSLIQVRNNIDKAWKNIDVLLQQRHDELTKLIDAVAGYVKHEREVLDSLTKLRVGYEQAGSTEEKVRLENQLNRGVQKLRAVWESYPTLKASENFLQLQNRVGGLESGIADRREFFNDSVNVYNIQIARFPEMLLARRMGYGRHEFLEVPEELKKDVRIAVT